MAPAKASDVSSSAVKSVPLPQQHARLPPKPWSDGLLVRLAPEIDATLTGVEYPTAALPLNNSSAPITFETALFKGAAIVRVADIPSSSTQNDYFSGKKRKLQVCVQGVFKQRLRFDQVYSGQEFAQPLARVPAKPLVRWAFQALKARLPANHLADLFGPLPYFLSPLILVSKIVRADPPAHLSEKAAEPPPIASLRIEEDLSYHVEQLTDASAKEAVAKEAAQRDRSRRRGRSFTDAQTHRAREHIFGAPTALADQWYEPGVVYTFDYFDSFFRPDNFSLDFVMKQIELGPILGEQPLVLTMAKTLDSGEYLWKFEIWHERSINDASPLFSSEAAASISETFSASSAQQPLDEPNAEVHVSDLPTPSTVDRSDGFLAARLNERKSSAVLFQQPVESPRQGKIASYSIDDLPEIPDPLRDVVTTGTTESKRFMPQESSPDAPDGFRVRRMADLEAFEVKLEAERGAAHFAKAEAKAARLAWAQAVYARANAQLEAVKPTSLPVRLSSHWPSIWCGCATPLPHGAATTPSASSNDPECHEPRPKVTSPHHVAATKSVITPIAPGSVTENRGEFAAIRGLKEYHVKSTATRSAPPYKGTAI